jgi:hypothetical protein
VDSTDFLVLCLGYTCLCGERVTVFRFPVYSDRQVVVSTKTVSCRNGHPRTVTLDQLGVLEDWTEEAEERAFREAM